LIDVAPMDDAVFGKRQDWAGDPWHGLRLPENLTNPVKFCPV